MTFDLVLLIEYAYYAPCAEFSPVLKFVRHGRVFRSYSNYRL